MSKKDACIADLKTRVLTLNLAPGAMLDEVSLSASYGLSRTPLREVLQRLSGEGYISLEANKGALVSAMDFAAMRQFFQTAPIIYCAISRLAAENATPVQLKKLKAAQFEFSKAKGGLDAGAMALANHRFHEITGQMSANPYLFPAMGRLLIDHTRMSQRFYRGAAPQDGVRINQAAHQHDLLIDAIEQRSPEEAVEITLDHWALSRGEIERYVWPDPLPNDFGPDDTARQET
ncbi:GntR family transcriptional regulator [Planktotalea sp.]|uniref:GntR family transcriptional regulator n=1 Tax=Planktotalea sp. TaxID=2029877 RepID=UPI003F6D2842